MDKCQDCMRMRQALWDAADQITPDFGGEQISNLDKRILEANREDPDYMDALEAYREHLEEHRE